MKTIVGDIEYGSNGEWKEPRVLQVQFHDVKGSDLDQWKTDARQTILWPDKYATGKIRYPYTEAKKATETPERSAPKRVSKGEIVPRSAASQPRYASNSSGCRRRNLVSPRDARRR